MVMMKLNFHHNHFILIDKIKDYWNEDDAPNSSDYVRGHRDIAGLCDDKNLHMDTQTIHGNDCGDKKRENWQAIKVICC